MGVGNKMERAKRAKQIRDAGRMEIMDAKRASRTAPKVVAILALNGDVNLESFLDQFVAAAGLGETGRGLHSSTFQLNVSAFRGTGGAFRGC